MSKSFLGLNALLAIASVLFAVQIGRGVVAPHARSDTRPRQAGSPAAKGTTTRPPVGIAPEPRQPLSSYASIPAKNLFSPARTESAGAAGAAPAGPRPFLHGTVMRDYLSIAYLEDPASKRVAGYRIGDAIAGGTVQAITPDHIVLKRPDGAVDVRLRDPLKPRPAPAEPAAPKAPGAPPAPAAAAGLVRPPVPQITGTVPAPATLLRRLPSPPALPVPPPIRDAPTR